jgi:hypothetical protein
MYGRLRDCINTYYLGSRIGFLFALKSGGATFLVARLLPY